MKRCPDGIWDNVLVRRLFFNDNTWFLGHPDTKGEDSKLPLAQPYRRLGPLKERHNDLVRVIDLSPNYIVSGSWDSSIKVWSRKNGSLLNTYNSPEGPISGIFLKESLKYLLFSARSGKVKRLDILADQSLKLSSDFEMNHGDCIIDMNVDGKYVLTGGSDSKLILWSYNEIDSKLHMFKI